jgi:putative tryptophan/tyrosine transport system substrate-binding protein
MERHSVGGRLSRRAFMGGLAGLGASAAALALGSGCGSRAGLGQPARVLRVGYISGDPPDAPWTAGLWDGLRDLGWVEGQTLIIERRGGQESSEVSTLIAELVAEPVDVLITVGSAITSAAKQATGSIPIVFISVSDPLGQGFVVSLARPGGNITGVSGGASTQLDVKRLELLKQVVPGLTRVAYISEAASTGGLGVARMQPVATDMGVQVQLVVAVSADDLTTAFATAERWPADAVLIGGVPGGAGRGGGRARIAELAAQARLPAMYSMKETVDAGGLMSYGNSQRVLNERAAIYVDKILRGAKPTDLPIEQLTTVEFVLNRKAAQALGLTIPPDVAAQVTEWVE